MVTKWNTTKANIKASGPHSPLYSLDVELELSRTDGPSVKQRPGSGASVYILPAPTT